MTIVSNLYVNNEEIEYFYYTNGQWYNASNMKLYQGPQLKLEQVPAFKFNPTGSKIIAVHLRDNNRHATMIYQVINGELYECSPRLYGYNNVEKLKILTLPVQLPDVDNKVVDFIRDVSFYQRPVTDSFYDQVIS